MNKLEADTHVEMNPRKSFNLAQVQVEAEVEAVAIRSTSKFRTPVADPKSTLTMKGIAERKIM